MPVTWSAAGLDEGIDWAGTATMPLPFSEACVTTIGEVIDLDWASFGAEPAAFASPATVVELVVAAAGQLALADYGTVAELEATLDQDDLLAVEYGAGLEAAGWALEDPAGAFFLEYLALRTRGIRWAPTADCFARLSVDDNVAEFCFGDDVFQAEAGSLAGVFPVYLSGSLTHEAGHVRGPGHTGPDQGYDADCNGTFGLSARVKLLWLENTTEELDQADLDAAEYGFNFTCSRIWEMDEACACTGQPLYPIPTY